MRQPPENSPTGRACSGGGEAEAAQDRGRARRRGVGVDVDEAGLDFGDPVRIVGGVGFGEQRIALDVGLEHHFDQAVGAVGRLLRQRAHAPARRDRDRPALGRELAADRPEQRRLAGAVAADQPDARAGHDLHRAVVDQKPAGEADRDVRDGKHARFVTAAALKRNGIARQKFRTPALAAAIVW